ncbi:zinc metallopeptidase [Anaerococcus degeneri]|uniref:Zinc metallopeptidase n=1 Tax=Anaerococcus degeneri TaxID=361500 RepID=A0ABS7YWQ1_9FIRM|nr:zinc metallopeptidase [Anaerococcus degeneri]MBP2015277.1 Zn-dependent membrane protease YugP [Anaerococcus degeneri]MCA2096173.1 zinc metallopeptidase [Anaerococcus degeneri]
MYPYGFYFDKTYFLVLIGLVISMLAQANITSKFNKYRKIRSKRGMTGAEAAQMVLDYNNYRDISIKRIPGSLSDYFNPMTKEVALSDTSFHDSSIASLAVALHEIGHVIQFKEGYIPLKVKSYMVPAVNFGSRLSFPILLAGVFMSQQKLITIGLALFSLTLLFQIVTLPVEFDASRRAIVALERTRILDESEITGAKDMLRSAALTYVAATLATALQLLRLFLLFGGRNRRD